MVFFTRIEPTAHYLEKHINEVPWERVIELIFTTKCQKKKGTKFEIEKEGYYILFEIKDNVLYVINAKKTR